MPLQLAGTGTVTHSSSDAFDTFTRADSTSTLNTASDGVHVWTPGLGTWGISSNKGYCPTLSGGLGYATVDVGVRNCTLQVTLSTVAYTQGVVLAYVNSSSYIRVYFFKIVGVDRMRMDAVGTAYFNVVDDIPWASGDILKVVLNGDAFTVYRNGVSVMADSDSRVGTVLGTAHGLYTTSTSARFDDFSVVT